MAEYRDQARNLELVNTIAETHAQQRENRVVYPVDFQAGARASSWQYPSENLLRNFPLRQDETRADLLASLLLGRERPGALSFTATLQSVQPEQGEIGREADVKKIAVLRCNAIGDFIFSLPALNALRFTYPEAEIVLLGLDWHAEFLRGRSGPVDRVEVVPLARGVSASETADEDPAELDRFFRKMVDEHFDIAIQMYGGGRYSNPFIRRLGARLAVGLKSPDAEPLDRWVPYNFYQLEIFRNLEVVSLVGARWSVLEPRLPVDQRDLDEAEQQVPSDGVPLAVLHPGAGDARRRWPTDKFAAVGNALAWAGAHVAVIGTERERDLVEHVIQQMATGAINLCNKLSLGGLAGLLSRAAVVVSNDSGPLHLASAVGAATVGIYWCGNMITAGQVSRSRHRPAISWRLHCPVCGLNCTRSACDHSVSFVSDVSQEEVIASALELISVAEQPLGAFQAAI